MLNNILTPFFFIYLFYFYLGKATGINFFFLPQISKSNNVHINIPGHLTDNLSDVSVSFNGLT